MSIILIASDRTNGMLFEALQKGLANRAYSVECLHVNPASNVQSVGNCAHKRLVLVGISGNELESGFGLSVLEHVANTNKTCGFGICMDSSGYGHCFATRRYIDRPDRVRLGIFLGSPAQFPQTHTLVRVSAPKFFVGPNQLDASIDDLVTAVIKAHDARLVGF